jgi:uncharacterized protein YndB with AHSA1/START domain
MKVRTLPAVEHRVRVSLAPSDAFDLFTSQVARWWPFPGHSAFDDEAVDLRIEGRVGGAVTEVARDGRTCCWGTVTAWTPAAGFAMQWHPGLPEAEATLLQVTFAALVGGGTEVSVHHSGWEARGNHAADKRDQYDGGWPGTLEAFTAFAVQQAASQ